MRILIRRRVPQAALAAAVAIALLGGSATYAQGTANHPAPKNGGTLNTALPVDPGTLDPRLETNTSTQVIDSLVFNGLVQIPNSLKPVPDLATKWTEVNPTLYVFQLRKNVKFQNGQPFTSQDVVYTYETVLNPTFKSPLIENYLPIKKVVADGPYEVKFELKQPYAPLLSYLTLGIVPHVVAGGKNFGSEPVGTGPYAFSSWQVNNQVTITENPNYYGTKAHIAKITFKIIPDNTDQVLGLEAGTLNLITSPLPYQYVGQIEKNPKYAVDKTVGVGTLYLNLNVVDPTLKDLKVREALQDVVSRSAIVKRLYYGVDTVAATQLIPGTWAWDASLKAPAYSLGAAKALLASDGWKKGQSGYLEKNGKVLAVQVSTYNDPVREQVVEYIQAQFAKLGIQATTSVSEWPSFLANVEAGKYQVALIGWLDLVDPDDAMYRQFETGALDNWGHYSNKTVDNLLNEARQVSSIPKRKALYVAASKIILEQVPYIVISDQAYVVMMSKNVHGFVIDRTGSLYTLANAWLG